MNLEMKMNSDTGMDTDMDIEMDMNTGRWTSKFREICDQNVSKFGLDIAKKVVLRAIGFKNFEATLLGTFGSRAKLIFQISSISVLRNNTKHKEISLLPL
jgi:hypothetical protein